MPLGSNNSILNYRPSGTKKAPVVESETIFILTPERLKFINCVWKKGDFFQSALVEIMLIPLLSAFEIVYIVYDPSSGLRILKYDCESELFIAQLSD